MAENSGTKVLAVIVTPDSEDTFATHDQDTGKGGFRAVLTEALMLAITTERRTIGMQVRVTDDGDPDKNGVYVLQDDLATFQKEEVDSSLGDPPDGDGGNSDGDTHALTSITTGDSQEEAWDKVLAYLDPGTGSYIFQLLIAAGLAIAYSLKVYWARIVMGIKQILNRSKKNDKGHD